jgi:hypothetical protein
LPPRIRLFNQTIKESPMPYASSIKKTLRASLMAFGLAALSALVSASEPAKFDFCQGMDDPIVFD